ncbi:MAG TPA: S9 family peptidase [Thermoanaerobaculia bacterium]|nr:S9 family peptidase [Thermoanaerobaculia bacterium]
MKKLLRMVAACGLPVLALCLLRGPWAEAAGGTAVSSSTPSSSPASSAASSDSAAATPATPARPAAAPAATAAVRHYTIEQFLATVNWMGGGFSPDGAKLLVTGNGTGVYNAYEVPAAGGEPTALTHSTTSAIIGLGYFPSGGRILYSSDQGGNELAHLYVRNADGSTRDLTPGAKLRAEFVGWAPDDRTFFFATNERDERFFDLYEMSVEGYERTLLYRNEEGFQPGAISPDRRYVALAKIAGTADADIYLFDRTTQKLQNLTAHEGEVANSPGDFSHDGTSLLYTTDLGAQFTRLMRYDIKTGQKSELLRPDWDVAGAGYSRDGRYLVVSINQDARTETRLFEAATMRPLKLPELPDADVTGVRFSHDGKQMAFYVESSRSPRNLYAGEVAALVAGAAPRQLTRALSPAIDPADLVAAEVVRFPSYDGVVIPGLLYRPKEASPEHPVPAVVNVHGGPGGQSRISYGGMVQYLVNHGYAVYAINNRGSSGYGKTFFQMADRKHGDADLGDCVASKRMLAATGWVRPDQIGIMGGSYGGYMVLAALAFRPAEFAVGVDLFGVSNWLRTLQSMPAWWGSERQALFKMIGDPAVDADYLRKISPLFHAEKIERPLLVLQGENDPRVLKVESDEIVAAARKRGTPVEYLIFPGEGHGFNRKETQEKAYKATLEFLDKYLKKNGGAGRPS